MVELQMKRKTDKRQNLPLDLEDGLYLRWADKSDVDALAAFNVNIHSPDPKKPLLWLGEWTRDLMVGHHPTTNASDFTVVVDRNQDGKIVSSLNLISQTWTFAGMPFGVGRIELVGTDPAYRRRGLVREQMAVIHALSQSKGELIQAITGIPWYYRQFGYEMTVNLGGGRKLFWDWSEDKKTADEKDFQIRKAAESDIPILNQLYTKHCRESLIVCKRDHEIWKYCLEVANEDTPATLQCHVIENSANKIVAYAEIRQWGTDYTIREVGVQEGESWREIGLFLVNWLRNQAIQLNPNREKPITNIHFNLGESHPIYRALDDKLGKKSKPYAWYIRVPDLYQFMRFVSPVLEERLANGVFAGYSGMLRINFYQNTMCLRFEGGKLQSVDSYNPKNWEDADVLFPGLTFLQLLFGYRSFQELDYAFADCYALKDETALLIDTLFPRLQSDISPLD